MTEEKTLPSPFLLRAGISIQEPMGALLWRHFRRGRQELGGVATCGVRLISKASYGTSTLKQPESQVRVQASPPEPDHVIITSSSDLDSMASSVCSTFNPSHHSWPPFTSFKPPRLLYPQSDSRRHWFILISPHSNIWILHLRWAIEAMTMHRNTRTDTLGPAG